MIGTISKVRLAPCKNPIVSPLEVFEEMCLLSYTKVSHVLCIKEILCLKIVNLILIDFIVYGSMEDNNITYIQLPYLIKKLGSD